MGLQIGGGGGGRNHPIVHFRSLTDVLAQIHQSLTLCIWP